ncbi:MAG: XRE family transcriptional regulator [Gallionella sp.]|jgi:transcriptional regulator with XRE-family HTH domain|nr:XRE family transcriptional regulator [Gallionella sp.]
MENVKRKFADRLKKAMLKAGYEPQAAVLERNFNLNYYGKPITLHGVRKWLIGESIPPYDKIIALAKMLRIPPDELTFGLEIKKVIKEERARWDDGIGYQEREVFEAFLALPAPQRKIVREVIQTFAKAFPAEVVTKHHPSKKP